MTLRAVVFVNLQNSRKSWIVADDLKVRQVKEHM